MKIKTTLLFAVALLLVSCGNKSENASMGMDLQGNTSSNSSNPLQQGKELIQGSDCFSCHAIDSKLIGPSYREVALRYKADTTKKTKEILASRIISGYQGDWGQVPMTPHPTLTKEQAEMMVNYILSLYQAK